MSTVYRAFDTVVGRDVAIKRLLPVEETRLNEAATTALAREAAALARFQHPNVVTIFAFESDAEGSFVVMELVDGEDLPVVIEKAPLTWEEFREVADQCLEALVAAGERKLLHRDIKPANLMLKTTPSGRYLVKLLDFGLAKFSQQPSVQTLDQQGSFLGSIEYIAPEQLELLPLDARTDLYSLGCVFYYMLTGRSPFAGANPAETSRNHVRHRCQAIAEVRPDLPPLVAAWIMRLISRYPEDRPGDAGEALRQYRDAIKGIAYEAPPSVPDIGEDDPLGLAIPVHPERPPAGGGAIKTPSGPIPTVRKITAPIASESPARAMNLPPVWRARPLRETVSPSSPGPSSPGGMDSPTRWRLPWGVFVAAASLVIGTIAVALLISDRDPRPPGPAPSQGGAADSPENSGRLPLLDYPVALTLSDGRPDPLPLPVEEGLYAHFSADKGVYGRDYLRAPEPGGPAAAWVNLVSPDRLRSLVRDLADERGEHLPRYQWYEPDEVPGFSHRRPGVTTTNRTSLSMMKHPGVLPRGFTLVAVLRIQGGGDRLFRIQPPVADGRFITLVSGQEDRITAVCRDDAEVPDRRVSVPWRHGGAGVLAYVWDPQKNKQELVVRLPGAAAASASGPIEFTGAAFGTVAIGKRGFDDPSEIETGNVFFEFVVYERVLDATELESLTKVLLRRYFAAR